MKKTMFLIQYGWIMTAVATAAFFVLSMTVYVTQTPHNVTEILPSDSALPDAENLTAISGDPESIRT